jgi:hypothetical protein
MPGNQYQQSERSELSQPDEAKIHHVTGFLVNLPTHSHTLHLHSHGRYKPCGQEQSEISVAQGAEFIDGY